MSVLQELRIPRMGSVENARLVSWRVAEGAAYSAGDVLYEIETDKTVTEVQADAPGTLVSQVAQEGTDLKVGDPVALWAAEGVSAEVIARSRASADASNAGFAGPTTHTQAPRDIRPKELAIPSGSSVESGPESLRLSPLVRRLAKEHGLDLSKVVGTGPSGRITGEDVTLAAARAKGSVAGGSTVGDRQPRDDSMTRSPATPADLPGYEHLPVEVVSNSTRRRAIARRLTEAVRAAPHLTADMQVDLTGLLARRERENSERRRAGKAAVSVFSYVVQATAQVLTRHLLLNATFADTHTFIWKTVNLGIAVDTSDGLIVPVLRDAATLSIDAIAAGIVALAERAREGALGNTDLEGGTFTISNPGALGPVLRAEAILNPPQVALLGLPAISHSPIAIEVAPGEYRVDVRPLLKPSLTFDHRALDGGHVIRFLTDLKAVLEGG